MGLFTSLSASFYGSKLILYNQALASEVEVLYWPPVDSQGKQVPSASQRQSLFILRTSNLLAIQAQNERAP